jgi:hypothetical protein
MSHLPTPASPLVLARVAGLLYLTVVPLGIFGVLYVPSSLIVPGDAATTAANIMASESLFRLGVVCHLLAPLFTLATALVLYRLLKPVGGIQSALMVLIVMLGVPIDLSGLANQFAALRFLGGADYLNVFTAEQLHALALFTLRYPGDIATIFWGLWLLPLGYLVFRSGLFPKILGVLLMASCFMYLIDSFSSLLGYRVNIGMFGAVGEVLFILWLLIKGINAGQWEKWTAESA